MPIFQELLNFNEIFRTLSEPPTIINDLVNNSEEDKELIKEMVTTRYSSDMITLLPSCRCGATKSESSIKVRCDVCGTIVKSSIEDDIEPTIWFRKPNGVNQLISPILMIMLKNRFKKKGFSILHWLIDTTYRPQVKQPPIVDKLLEMGAIRGYNNFVENFDKTLEVLFSIKQFQLKKGQEDYLRRLIYLERHKVFSDYIPLPNKSLLIIEKTNVGIYVDNIIVEAVDAIEMLVSIDKNFYDQTPKVKENRTAKALLKLSEFYERFYKSNLSLKPGQFRRHIFGTRTNFAFRAVITSLTDSHDYRDIYVPWGVGLTAFRSHLLNKLLKLGMDINSAIGLLLGHVEKYHPLLDKLLEELIAETPYGRIPVILQRNPSLLQGSAQTVGITRFKKDPSDHTISMSILIVSAMNADFDGDSLNVSISLDNFMAEKWYPLEPRFNIFQLSKPHEISKNISMPKPIISTISAFLDH